MKRFILDCKMFNDKFTKPDFDLIFIRVNWEGPDDGVRLEQRKHRAAKHRAAKHRPSRHSSTKSLRRSFMCHRIDAPLHHCNLRLSCDG